jgi:Predicted transcriptional regulators
MSVEEKFVSVSALICEPVRAKMLWNLLDGRAYTASELSVAADISPSAASNHLAKLLNADIVKVEHQGRHRYYSLAGPEVAYVVEGLANLANNSAARPQRREPEAQGIKYCRSCYDHLAGYVGVKITETLEKSKCLVSNDRFYEVTAKGWKYLDRLGIAKDGFYNNRRPLARQCLDWSERRPHIAGQLGAEMLNRMLAEKWFKKVKFSRELIITSKGRQELYDWLGITL